MRRDDIFITSLSTNVPICNAFVSLASHSLPLPMRSIKDVVRIIAILMFFIDLYKDRENLISYN